MKNFVQSGNSLTLTAPYAVSAGDGALIGDIFGVAAIDADNGADVDLVTVGVFSMAKVALDAFAVGEPVYWDDAAKLVTASDGAGANPKIGTAVEAAAGGSAAVAVRLSGAF